MTTPLTAEAALVGLLSALSPLQIMGHPIASLDTKLAEAITNAVTLVDTGDAWRSPHLTRLQRIKEHRAQFNSSLGEALAAVDACIAVQQAQEAKAGGPLKPADVEWVVNDNGELGVKVGGQFFFLYKGESLVYHDYEDSPRFVRKVLKREFGECCRPEVPVDHVNDGEEWQRLPLLPVVEGEADGHVLRIRDDSPHLASVFRNILDPLYKGSTPGEDGA